MSLLSIIISEIIMLSEVIIALGVITLNLARL